MSKMRILGGTVPQETTFYYNPGAISDHQVTEVIPVGPEELKKAGVRQAFSLFKKAYFVAEFGDGKRALVETDTKTYKRLLRDISDGPVSTEEIEGRKKDNTRMMVIFCVVYAIGAVVFSEYLTGWLPHIAAFGLAIVAGVVSRGMSFGR